MSQPVVATYTGSTPGANTDEYTLFSSVAAWTGKRMHQMGGLNTIIVSIHHAGVSADGQLRVDKSDDRGTTWIAADDAVVPRAVADTPHLNEFNIAPYDDFRVQWINSGGVAQTTWEVSVALSEERAGA